MSNRTWVYRPVVSDLPDDFGERIEEFRVASGLSVRSLARLLGVSPHRLREWRRGVAPASGHLYALITIAEAMGLRGILVRPDEDLPAGFRPVPPVDSATNVR
ncbi:MAG: helix-turn-helix transcriptional regulator [Chloroflexi bacterium]|nr:helix-turn-helix transcriptional regulator [Chloroflexota bacterium]